MSNKALFLDRDGIIIEDAGYTRDPAAVRLIPEIVPLLQTAKKQGYTLIVVTNQSGIGRGSISLADYFSVSERMLALLNQAQAPGLDQIYFAPYFGQAQAHIEQSLKDQTALSQTHFYPLTLLDPSKAVKTMEISNRGLWSAEWRKPEIGMLTMAQKEYPIDLNSSLMIGDRLSDQQLAIKAQLPKSLWYQAPGQTPPPSPFATKIHPPTKNEEVEDFLNEHQQVQVITNLIQALDFL